MQLFFFIIYRNNLAYVRKGASPDTLLMEAKLIHGFVNQYQIIVLEKEIEGLYKRRLWIDCLAKENIAGYREMRVRDGFKEIEDSLSKDLYLKNNDRIRIDVALGLSLLKGVSRQSLFLFYQCMSSDNHTTFPVDMDQSRNGVLKFEMDSRKNERYGRTSMMGKFLYEVYVTPWRKTRFKQTHEVQLFQLRSFSYEV